MFVADVIDAFELACPIYQKRIKVKFRVQYVIFNRIVQINRTAPLMFATLIAMVHGKQSEMDWNGNKYLIGLY